MVHYCSVPQCGGKWRKGGNHLRFHAFPRNENMRKLWQTSIQRLHRVSESAKVCSKHFKESDYITAPSGYQYLTKSAVPSLNLPKRKRVHDIPLSSNATFSVDNSINVEVLLEDADCLEELNVKQEVKFTPDTEVMPQYHGLNRPIPDCDRFIRSPLLSCDSMTNDELNYFTGLSNNCFEKFLSILTKQPFSLPSCNLSADNQLFLTLCKMKHNFSFDYISVVLKVEPNDAFIVFSFWTYTLFRVMKALCGNIQTEPSGSISIAIVQVKVLKHYTSCLQKLSTSTKLSSFRKGVVAVDDCKPSIYFCSKLYDESTALDDMLHYSGLKASLPAGTSIVVNLDLLQTNYFENMNVKVESAQVSHCVCGTDVMTHCQASRLVMSNKCFQCLVEMYY
ncbi:DNA transposase, partial [Frankliniella fusca]